MIHNMCCAKAEAMTALDKAAVGVFAFVGSDGLPRAFIHPDFVMANVVATADPGMVLVDWAGAGVGPRAWALAFLLWAEAAKDPRRAALALAGYRRRIALEPEEIDRLAGMLRARPLIFSIWRLRYRGTTAAAAAEDALETRRLADLLAARIREAAVSGPPPPA